MVGKRERVHSVLPPSRRPCSLRRVAAEGYRAPSAHQAKRLGLMGSSSEATWLESSAATWLDELRRSRRRGALTAAKDTSEARGCRVAGALQCARRPDHQREAQSRVALSEALRCRGRLLAEICAGSMGVGSWESFGSRWAQGLVATSTSLKRTEERAVSSLEACCKPLVAGGPYCSW